ncbi:unnamed protein product [Victoria cruziana]
MGEAKWRLVLVPLFVGLLAAGAEDEPPVQIYPSNGGQLCARAPAATVASTALDLLTVFSLAAVLLVL